MEPRADERTDRPSPGLTDDVERAPGVRDLGDATDPGPVW